MNSQNVIPYGKLVKEAASKGGPDPFVQGLINQGRWDVASPLLVYGGIKLGSKIIFSDPVMNQVQKIKKKIFFFNEPKVLHVIDSEPEKHKADR